jgi:predicted DNA-binding transcriptional regulator AlpA
MEKNYQIYSDGEECLDFDDLRKLTGLTIVALKGMLSREYSPKPVIIGKSKFWKRSEVEKYIKELDKVMIS